VVLQVQRAAWLEHARAHAASYAPVAVVPVVKGNGYGFGRATLFPVAAELSPWVCVGTVHELDGVPDAVTPVVLTPSSTPPGRDDAVLTVGHLRDVGALIGWAGRVMVKLESSMRRYGASPDELAPLLAAANAAGLEVVAASIHLPLAGDDPARVAEVRAWLARLPDGLPLWVSHLSVDAAHDLAPDCGHLLTVRSGTALWHGDKSFLHLGADVVYTRTVSAGDRVGYRHAVVPGDGTLVLVGAGSTHGVAELADGRSPFHFARRRLALVEPPHMHTSMVFVPAGDRVPVPGDPVDVQRPLTTTAVDLVEWV